MPSYLEPNVGGSLWSREQIVVDRIGSHSESAVDDPSVDVDAKIHLQHVVILEENFFTTRIWSPVSSDVVQAEPGWKRQSGLECVTRLDTLVTSESSDALFNLVCELAHGDTWFCNGLYILTDLAMDFGGFAIILEVFIVHITQDCQMTNFLGRSALEVVVTVGIVDDFALGIWLIVEDAGKCNSRRGRLLFGAPFRLLRLGSLSLFLRALINQFLSHAACRVFPTSGGLTVSFQVSSSLGIIVITPIFIFAFKGPVEQAAGRGRFWGILSGGNRGAGG
jgi:hypothetical protein